jgi:hypothetical protein
VKKYLYLILFALIAFFPGSVSGNWQYWSHYEIVNSIDENLDFKVKPELRFDENFSNHYYTHFDIGFDWEVVDWFIFSPYYRHVNEKYDEIHQVEYRPHLNITFKWKALSFINTSDRNRIEIRIKEEETSLRYRNQLTIKMSKFTRYEFQPYIADEFFYDFESKEINKNRLYAGTDFKTIKNIKIGLCYILESAKREDSWRGDNVFQSSIKFGF